MAHHSSASPAPTRPPRRRRRRLRKVLDALADISNVIDLLLFIPRVIWNVIKAILSFLDGVASG